MISVGASVRGGSVAAYSNKGATMLAPGGDWADPIVALTVSSTGQLALLNSVGTSMATPHVAVAVALVMRVWRYLAGSGMFLDCLT